MTGQDGEFLEIFRDEANERLDSFVDTLLALEAGRGAPDAVDSLFRDAHTIKGGAGMLGLDNVRALADAIEDVLANAREAGAFPTDLADPLLRAADALRRHVEGTGEPSADLLEELAASRGRLLEGAGGVIHPAEPELPRPPPSAARSACRRRRSTACSTSSARPCSTAGASSTSSATRPAAPPRRSRTSSASASACSTS